jgi:hypothetical protein
MAALESTVRFAGWVHDDQKRWRLLRIGEHCITSGRPAAIDDAVGEVGCRG